MAEVLLLLFIVFQ